MVKMMKRIVEEMMIQWLYEIGDRHVIKLSNLCTRKFSELFFEKSYKTMPIHIEEN